jgi:hypothetical protein
MTMSNAILYRMAAGIPGTISRAQGQALVETGIIDTDYPPASYGIPIKHVSGKTRPIAAGDTLASVAAGFLVRPFPTQGTTNEALGDATPNPAQPSSEMKRGYIMVKVNASLPAAVPAKDGVVYCRKTDHGAAEYPIGGVESDADAGKCEAIPGAYFTGAMDANGLCEVAYNL